MFFVLFNDDNFYDNTVIVTEFDVLFLLQINHLNSIILPMSMQNLQVSCQDH